MSSIVFRNNTGALYWLIDLWCKNETAGKENERYALYKKPAHKTKSIMRVSEFSCSFTHWKEWLKNGGKCNA
jgi:hypothetical protein